MEGGSKGCSSDSLNGLARSSSSRRTRPAPSSTTTSARSTSCSACCARRRTCGSRARVARHHGRGGARAGRPHRRPGRRGHDGANPVHAAREEGVGAGAARGALLGHNYIGTEHILLGLVRETRGRSAHPARLRRRRREDSQRDHPHALRPGPAAAEFRRGSGEKAKLEAARPVRAQSHEGRNGRKLDLSSGARPRSSA